MPKKVNTLEPKGDVNEQVCVCGFTSTSAKLYIKHFFKPDHKNWMKKNKNNIYLF